jgi:hypothetical protein
MSNNLIPKGQRDWALTLMSQALARGLHVGLDVSHEQSAGLGAAEILERICVRRGITTPCTYFIADKSRGVIKIGKSDTPHARLRTLQTANAERLTLELILTEMSLKDWQEDRLHSRFNEYRLSGEWFQYSPELREFVQLMVEKL